ncbi:MAG TPA: metallophosphoesterase family protein [Pirellulales bacterium]|nr:metallophosphoesterase family protein [Pirellulales bacterium]
MRVLAIGDIHGCYSALLALVGAVGLGSDDLLITLGDYVDRGPDSAGVLDWLIERRRKGNLVSLLGNHERMMLDSRTNEVSRECWLSYGGEATLVSYQMRGGEGDLDDVPDEHWEFLEHGCRNWYETDSHFFVHANALADLPFDEQPEEFLLWERLYDPIPHQSGKTMVCGHTPQSSGVPLNFGHAVCIDTWACGAGWLTCLDVATGEYWQANQRGGLRGGELARPWLPT